MHTENWLVISNCTTHGIANCLQSQTSAVNIFGVDTSMLSRDLDEWQTKIIHYDRIFVNVDAMRIISHIEQIASRLRPIPFITSSIYHPDFIDINTSKGPIRTLSGHYNSMIVYAAYCSGIDVNRVESLFCSSMYNRLGYFGSMDAEKKRLIQEFKNFNIDITPYVHQWGRDKPFMYSCNHPTIDMIYDICSAILESENVEYSRDSFRPSDQLTLGSIPPVLKEIADHLGSTEGTYDFRDVGSYKKHSLKEYITFSYKKYEEMSLTQNSVNEPFDQIVRSTINSIEEFFKEAPSNENDKHA